MKGIEQQKNLWPGLASYKEGGYRFCGRTNATSELVKLIDNNLFVTLYGRTGVGKTSLLNAGVFPMLRGKNYVPISLRPGMDARETLMAAVIVEKIREQLIEVRHEAVSGESYDPRSVDYLWRYFCTTHFRDKSGREVYPVVVLDQLEEVFITRGDEARFLMQQIYCLLDDGRVVPNTPGYSDETNFRFVISLREDNLFYLEDCIDKCFLTEMKRNRYRLTPLTREDARDVILTPGRNIIKPGEQEEVVKHITDLSKGIGGEISSLILSLICSQLYDKIIIRDKGEYITIKDVEQMSKLFLEEFYDKVINRLPGAQRKYLEEHLVSDDGRRESMSEQAFKKHIPDGDYLLDDETRLLQRTPTSSGQQRIELVHDILALVMFKRRIERTKTVNLMQNLVLVGLFDMLLMFCCAFWVIYYTTVQNSELLGISAIILFISTYFTNLCRNCHSKKLDVPLMFFIGFSAMILVFYHTNQTVAKGTLSLKVMDMVFDAFLFMAIIHIVISLYSTIVYGYILNDKYTWKQLLLLDLEPKDRHKSFIQLGSAITGLLVALVLSLSTPSVQSMRTDALKGDTLALCNLGDYYVEIGVNQEHSRALYEKAASLGSKLAGIKLDDLESGKATLIDEHLRREAMVAFLEDSISISESLDIVEGMRDSSITEDSRLEYIYRYYVSWGQLDIAQKWLTLAARGNQPWAMRILGVKMLTGNGMHQDRIGAYELFKEGAELGDYGCARLLVAACYFGWGTEQNIPLAHEWAKKLVDEGGDENNLLISMLAL